MVAAKTIWYIGFILLILIVLNQFEINLAPLLGAAGVLGLAVGFASQTSVSNVISGIFLIAEKSFEVDDVITVGTTTGVVLSIDTLSVKLRTFDNRYVRIPNETMIKTEVINVSRFPIRRADVMVGVAYKEDLEKVKALLSEIAASNPNVLNDPPPIFIFQAFGASSLDLQFSVWAEKDNWLQVKNEMYEAIKLRFEKEDVEIPFPHISIYKGEATDPLPVEVVTSHSSAPPAVDG
jgi:small-conductance mechanosensitive channel